MQYVQVVVDVALAGTNCLHYVALNIKRHGDLDLSLLEDWAWEVDVFLFMHHHALVHNAVEFLSACFLLPEERCHDGRIPSQLCRILVLLLGFAARTVPGARIAAAVRGVAVERIRGRNNAVLGVPQK